MNGDNIISKDDIEGFILNTKDYGCLAKYSKTPFNHGVLNIGKEGKILSIIEKPKVFISSLVNGGMYIVNDDFIKIAMNVRKSERGEYEITDALNEFILNHNFSFYKLNNKHYDLTTPIDIYKTGRVFLDKFNIGNEYKNINQKGKNYIGKLCNIGKNTIIENCIIDDFVNIGENCILKNCLIGEKSNIGNNFKYLGGDIKIISPNSSI